MKIPFLNVHVLKTATLDQLKAEARAEGKAEGKKEAIQFSNRQMNTLLSDNITLAQRNILMAKKLGYKQR